jgi:CpXC protein
MAARPWLCPLRAHWGQPRSGDKHFPVETANPFARATSHRAVDGGALRLEARVEMTISGTYRMRCAGCGVEQDAALVQSINARLDPDLVERLLAGTLNLHACRCGRLTQLAATLVFHDPARDYFCQVCPGGEAAMARGAEAFARLGELGTRRLVGSQNELVERLRLHAAGLDDWKIEMLKVLLLASLGDAIERVLLFEHVDRVAGVIGWRLFDDQRRTAQALTSPLAAYDKLSAAVAPADRELRVDRGWAIAATQAMIAARGELAR